MSIKEKLELYWKVKEAYYNGEEIMSDLEFDTLEKELGLENKSKIGASHNPSYTVEHPVIMGSLSKVQIHKNDNGEIIWDDYFADVQKYICKNHTEPSLIITPKYDGCSFEITTENFEMISASTRGDGEFGRDIKHIISQKFDCKRLPNGMLSILRGEVLIKKSVFVEKYADEFVNPRSFVSGMLNRDPEDTMEYRSKIDDLDIVIYDYRYKKDDRWIDLDWTALSIEDITPQYWKEIAIKSSNSFEQIYREFDEYRIKCEYALDGFVIKPCAELREMQTTPRPKDCVAIKFIPMIEPTTITSIEWNLGKTGELTPIIHVDPVEMDGKLVSKCSGHNYGYLTDNLLSPGCKVILSLAGDIIPFLYKIVDTSNYSIDKLNVPTGCYVDGCHLMKEMTNEERNHNAFVNSAMMLNIPNIGKATAEAIYEYVTQDNGETDDFFEDMPKNTPVNILQCSTKDIYFGAGAGKAGKNAEDSFAKFVSIGSLRMRDIIKSCCFELCGNKASEQIENFLLGNEYDFAHLPEKSWIWAQNNNSSEMTKLIGILSSLGYTIDDFKKINDEISNNQSKTENQIPVIMTGNPNDYESKGQFLKCHPEYRSTTKWKECKILFTNSMDSATGKMKKAKELGIEIRLY